MDVPSVPARQRRIFAIQAFTEEFHLIQGFHIESFDSSKSI
jgi:hypothetical protein